MTQEKFPNLTFIVRRKLKEKFAESVIAKEFYLSKEKGKDFKADAKIDIKENTIVFIEVEETQCHPDTNVSKYWMYLEENPKKKVILIQFFGRAFSESENNYLTRKNLSKFIGKKMEKEFGNRYEYFYYDLKYELEEYKTKSEEIADEMVKYIEYRVKAEKGKEDK